MLRLKRLVVILLLLKENIPISALEQCLTWNLYNDENIRFICRVSNFEKPVLLTDNHRHELVKCTFYNEIKACHPNDLSQFVRANYTNKEVIFYVDRKSLREYYGKWSCTFGKEVMTTIVSNSKGIITDINVTLESSLRTTNEIQLTCSSCMEPVRNNAEFGINGRSEKSLSYDKRSGNCIETTSNKSCTPDVCACAASGNEFSISLPINTTIRTSFFCDLIFSDPITSAKFSIKAEFEFNKGVSSPTETRTKIFKSGIKIEDIKYSTTSAPSEPNLSSPTSTLTHYQKGQERIWIVIGILFVLIIVLFVWLLKKKILKCDKRASTEKSLAHVKISLLEDEKDSIKIKHEENSDGTPMLSASNTCTDMELRDGSTEFEEAVVQPTCL